MDVVSAPRVLVEGSASVLRRWEASNIPLTSVEFDRAATLRREQDRTDYVAAHLLAREAAALFIGRPAASLQLASRCPDCASVSHGRPLLVDVAEVSISMSRARGVVAAVAGLGAMGIDAEPLHAVTDLEALADTVLTAHEKSLVYAAADPHGAFLRLWVRKEALVKAGDATLDGLSSLDLSDLGVDSGVRPRAARWRAWHLLDLHVSLDDDAPGASLGAIRGALVSVVAATPPLWHDGALAREP